MPLEWTGRHYLPAAPPQAPCLPLRGSVRLLSSIITLGANLQEQTMIPFQEINFYLSSNQVIFAHVIQQHDGTFIAEATQAHDLGNIPSVKEFLMVACPANANAETAFRQVFSVVQSHCKSNGDSTLVKVNNPCNCEFLSTQDQQHIVGQAVRVVTNEKL